MKEKKIENESLENSKTFRLLLLLLVLLPLLTFIVSYNSYCGGYSIRWFQLCNDIQSSFSITKIIASTMFAITAFYALWFRTNQTKNHIDLQLKIDEENKVLKKADILISELHYLFECLDEFTSVKKPLPLELAKLVALKKDYLYDHYDSHKIPEVLNHLFLKNDDYNECVSYYQIHGHREPFLKWHWGQILTLFVHIKMYVKNESDFKDFYRTHCMGDERDINNIVVYCRMTLEICDQLSNTTDIYNVVISTKTRILFPVVEILCEFELIEVSYLEKLVRLQNLKH